MGNWRSIRSTIWWDSQKEYVHIYEIRGRDNYDSYACVQQIYVEFTS